MGGDERADCTNERSAGISRERASEHRRRDTWHVGCTIPAYWRQFEVAAIRLRDAGC